MAEIIYLQTTNGQKLEEYQRILGQHRVEVRQVSVDTDPRDLLRSGNKKERILSVLKEESKLIDPTNGHEISRDNLQHLQALKNLTVLKSNHLDKDDHDVVEEIYLAEVEGFISLELEPIPDLPIFGWDAQFVSVGTQLSYQQMRARGLKLSARDQVIAQFARAHLNFDKRRNWRCNPQSPTRTVDFSLRPIDFVRLNNLINHPQNRLYGVSSLIHQALNLGPFFRAAGNRRESIYWFPGGNGGIPFTPKINKQTGKADDIHEITFFIHDLAHHILNPDLIFEGSTDLLDQRIQIIWRMMSEALTLVFADMLFVDTLRRNGTDYDYNRRKIYPLFASMPLDFTADQEALKQLYFANVRYALRGDDSIFKNLGASVQALEQYKSKYGAYFVEDFQWTKQNVTNMCSDAENFQRWRRAVQPLTHLLGHYLKGCITVSECKSSLTTQSPQSLKQLSVDQLIALIFELVWKNTIQPSLTVSAIQPDDDLALRSGFLKYLMAQMFIFSVFDFIPESRLYQDRLIDFLALKINSLNQKDILIIRGHFDQYVDILARRNAISEEDQAIHKEIFPLYPPFYIYYDRNHQSYESLASVSEAILRG